MIDCFTHVTLYVLSQDEAKAFYTEKLDFAVRMDFRMDNGFRWLTVSPQDQHDVQIVLLQIDSPHVHPQTATALKHLLKEGILGATIVLQTQDCRKTIAGLAAKGVTIISPPTEHFHGTEAIFADNSGNRFTLHQPKGN